MKPVMAVASRDFFFFFFSLLRVPPLLALCLYAGPPLTVHGTLVPDMLHIGSLSAIRYFMDISRFSTKLHS